MVLSGAVPFASVLLPALIRRGGALPRIPLKGLFEKSPLRTLKNFYKKGVLSGAVCAEPGYSFRNYFTAVCGICQARTADEP